MAAPILTVLTAAASLWMGEGVEVCSLHVEMAAGAGEAVVLAVATEERHWIDAVSELPEDGWPIAREGAPQVWGQVFEILATRGPLAEPRESILVVPWEYDPACDLRAWTDSVWVSPGDTVVFKLSSASRAARRAGTFHTLGWHWPYPTGELIQYRFRPLRDDPWLSAREYFELLAVLPTSEAMRAGSPGGLSRLRRWAEERGLQDHFPLNEILWFWERAERGG